MEAPVRQVIGAVRLGVLPFEDDDLRERIVFVPGGVRGLDPRTRLALVVATSAVCMALGGEGAVIVVLLATAAAVTAGGRADIAVRCIAAYVAVKAAVALTTAFQVPGLSAVLVVIGFTLMKFVPALMLAWWFVATVKTGDLLCALLQAHVPKTAAIPLVVMARYLPTLGQEARHIRDTMRMRGVVGSPSDLAKAPLRTLECVLVPLLMRCLKVADELAASAVSRGIEATATRTSVRDVRLRLRDGAALIGAAVVFAAAFALDAGCASALVAQLLEGGAR